MFMSDKLLFYLRVVIGKQFLVACVFVTKEPSIIAVMSWQFTAR